ncbi:MAG: protein kinase, partial [Holophagales bacterium]|nr:protein kinase [Holophagales bacterium]
TPSYMAPEQIRGEDLSPQADLYAIGCLLFEMLCRRPVFGTGPTSFHHHLTSRPADPTRYRSDVPDELALLVLRCLAKNPAERPRSAAEIERELTKIRAQL